MNKYYLIILLPLFFQSCITLKKNSHQRDKEQISDLTHKVIYSKFGTDWVKKMEDKGEYIYIAPMLKFREELYPGTDHGFDKILEAMSIENLEESNVKKDSIRFANDIFLDYTVLDSFLFTIKESHENVIQYFSDTINIRTEKKSSFFFSPILPTKEKDIYLLQFIAFGEEYPIPESLYFYYSIWRFFEKYHIKDNKITYLETLYFEPYSWAIEKQIND